MSLIEDILLDAEDVDKPDLRGYLAAREIFSVTDPEFGGLGNGIADDAAAIIACHETVAPLGGAVFFQPGTFIVSTPLPWDETALGVTWYGSGQAGGSAYGTMIKYTGTTDADLAVIKVSAAASFVCNSIQNMTINANSKAGMCLHLDAYDTTARAQKHWRFDRVDFNKATRALVLIGDATWSAGDYAATTRDCDAHMNVFKECNFTPMSSTLYGLVVNVANNAYQTTLEDCSFEGDASTLAAVRNFIRQKSGNSLVARNVFFPNIPTDAASGDTYACCMQEAGSLDIEGGGSEEARLIYKTSIATSFNHTCVSNFNVNDPADNGGSPTSPKVVSYNKSSAPMTFLNCHFADVASGLYSRKVHNDVVCRWRAENCDFGTSPTFVKCTPVGVFVTRTFAAGNFTGQASMTWAVEAADVKADDYSFDGRIMHYKFHIQTTVVGGTPDGILSIAIPLGCTAKTRSTGTFAYYDNSTDGVGTVDVPAGGTVINLYKGLVGEPNWTAGTVYVCGEIDIEVDI